MATSKSVRYRFTVKEGAPSEPKGEAPTFLACEPFEKDHAFLRNNGFLTIELKEGTSVEKAEEVAKYLNQHFAGIGVTTF